MNSVYILTLFPPKRLNLKEAEYQDQAGHLISIHSLTEAKVFWMKVILKAATLLTERRKPDEKANYTADRPYH